MYAARIDTIRYTFQASGSLWQDALVMQDRETQSLWSQISAECIVGEKEGAKLTLFPSFHTTFAEFQELYPEGLVLAKPVRGDRGSHYDGYFADSSRLGIFGRSDNFSRLSAKAHVFGLRLDGREIAIARDHIAVTGLVTLGSMSPPVVVTYDSATETAAAFALDTRFLPDLKKLEVSSGRLAIPGDINVWDAYTGATVSGTAPPLEPVPLISAFWFAWVSFFPETDLVDRNVTGE